MLDLPSTLDYLVIAELSFGHRSDRSRLVCCLVVVVQVASHLFGNYEFAILLSHHRQPVSESSVSNTTGATFATCPSHFQTLPQVQQDDSRRESLHPLERAVIIPRAPGQYPQVRWLGPPGTHPKHLRNGGRPGALGNVGTKKNRQFCEATNRQGCSICSTSLSGVCLHECDVLKSPRDGAKRARCILHKHYCFNSHSSINSQTNPSNLKQLLKDEETISSFAFLVQEVFIDVLRIFPMFQRFSSMSQ